MDILYIFPYKNKVRKKNLSRDNKNTIRIPTKKITTLYLICGVALSRVNSWSMLSLFVTLSSVTQSTEKTRPKRQYSLVINAQQLGVLFFLSTSFIVHKCNKKIIRFTELIYTLYDVWCMMTTVVSFSAPLHIIMFSVYHSNLSSVYTWCERVNDLNRWIADCYVLCDFWIIHFPTTCLPLLFSFFWVDSCFPRTFFLDYTKYGPKAITQF